jgi:hypothetical protein
MNPVLVPCYYSNVSVWGGGERYYGGAMLRIRIQKDRKILADMKPE